MKSGKPNKHLEKFIQDIHAIIDKKTKQEFEFIWNSKGDFNKVVLLSENIRQLTNMIMESDLVTNEKLKRAVLE